MNKVVSTITVLIFVCISCSQNATTIDKEYIKNLEEKNKALEKELNEAKENGGGSISQDSKAKKKTSKDYFTIGSTEDEVLAVMGDPTNYVDLNSFGKRFYYGSSMVIFEKGKVVTYHNYDDNLKVRVKQ